VNRWTVRTLSHLHDTWEILFEGRHAGYVHWVIGLRHPHLTRARIADGLNGVHGAAQPCRTWAFGTEGSPGRYDLNHNGATVGEIAWNHQPPVEPEVWQDRILAGLNYVSTSRTIDPPEPAPHPIANAS
jgi:hypothetical protein